MSDDRLLFLSGWCMPAEGAAETYHQLCPGHITSTFGVTRWCSCPNHPQEEDDQ